jgi:RNA polymerase sigma-70 factor (ECF subfamily)
MADTRIPSFLRVAGSSSPPAANPQVERMIGVSDPYRLWVDGLQLAEINGQPGALFVDREGGLVVAVSLEIAEGLVQTLRAVTNPDKLSHLRSRLS